MDIELLEKALEICDGNVERATEMILSGDIIMEQNKSQQKQDQQDKESKVAEKAEEEEEKDQQNTEKDEKEKEDNDNKDNDKTSKENVDEEQALAGLKTMFPGKSTKDLESALKKADYDIYLAISFLTKEKGSPEDDAIEAVKRGGFEFLDDATVEEALSEVGDDVALAKMWLSSSENEKKEIRKNVAKRKLKNAFPQLDNDIIIESLQPLDIMQIKPLNFSKGEKNRPMILFVRCSPQKKKKS